MNIALSVDSVLFRDDSFTTFDCFVDYFDQAPVFTFAHRPGRVLGPLERRKVHASFLSHKVEDVFQLRKNSYLVPSASKKLSISCSYDLVVNFSRGLSHGISRCENTKQLTYLYDLDSLPQKGSLRERFFGAHVNRWAMKNLDSPHELWVSSETLKSELALYTDRSLKVVTPFIDLHEFPPIPENVYAHDFYLINAESLTVSLAQKLLKVLPERGLAFRFVGADQHLDVLKTQEKKNLFAGVRCGGELAPLLAASRGLLDIGSDCGAIPQMALQALSCGRPVVAAKTPLREEFLNLQGVLFLNSFKNQSDSDVKESLMEVLDRLDQVHDQFRAQELHNKVKSFHKAGFLGHLKRFMAK